VKPALHLPKRSEHHYLMNSLNRFTRERKLKMLPKWWRDRIEVNWRESQRLLEQARREIPADIAVVACYPWDNSLLILIPAGIVVYGDSFHSAGWRYRGRQGLLSETMIF
jgi:hypothetical protein